MKWNIICAVTFYFTEANGRMEDWFYLTPEETNISHPISNNVLCRTLVKMSSAVIAYTNQKVIIIIGVKILRGIKLLTSAHLLNLVLILHGQSCAEALLINC